jgi:hypothetical protein
MFCLIAILGPGILYFVLDNRPPIDLGHYYYQLPEFVNLYNNNNSLSFLSAILEIGGWYNAVLALIINAFGADELIFQIVGIGWMIVLWYSLRRQNSFGLLLLCCMPILQTSLHTHWLHFVEASFFIWLLFVPQRRWLWMVSAILLVMLRPTSIFLILSGVVLCYRSSRIEQAKYLFLGLFIALCVMAPHLIDYVQGKATLLHSSSRPLFLDLFEGCFLSVLLISFIGLVLWYKNKQWVAFDWFCLFWIVFPIFLALIFGVGIDNFILFYISLALLAGKGWMSLCSHKRIVSLPIFLLVLCVKFVPYLPQKYAEFATIPLSKTIVSQEPWHHLRPQPRALQVHHISPFLDELCELSDESCTIVSSMGLFHPSREDDGSLALFLAGVEDVTIHNASLWWTKQHLEGKDRVEGVIIMHCSLPDEPLIFQKRIEALGRVPEQISVEHIGTLGPPSCPFHLYKFLNPSSIETVLQLKKLGQTIQ